MIVKVNQVLKDYEEKPLKEGMKEVNLKSILVNTLNYISQNPNEKSTIEDKLKAYKLSIQIMSKDEVDFALEDLVLIKKNLNLMYTPLIVGQVTIMIESGIPKKEVKTN